MLINLISCSLLSVYLEIYLTPESTQTVIDTE